jgi:hypothetical protein
MSTTEIDAERVRHNHYYESYRPSTNQYTTIHLSQYHQQVLYKRAFIATCKGDDFYTQQLQYIYDNQEVHSILRALELEHCNQRHLLLVLRDMIKRLITNSILSTPQPSHSTFIP